MIWMPDDHTAGVGTGDPYPVAEVADNDLAVGRIVNSIAHSKEWKSSLVMVVEDDTQNGVDHVDGHRGPLLIASPYAKRGVVNSDYYTLLNAVKTVEQILGIAPMNQEDRAATPMSDAFTNTPDDAPYNVLPNQIPLTEGLTAKAPATKSVAAAGKALAPETPAQANIPVAVRGIYAQWVVWSRNGRFNGTNAIQDFANPAQLNRLDWYSAHNWEGALPGRQGDPDARPGARGQPAR